MSRLSWGTKSVNLHSRGDVISLRKPPVIGLSSLGGRKPAGPCRCDRYMGCGKGLGTALSYRKAVPSRSGLELSRLIRLRPCELRAEPEDLYRC